MNQASSHVRATPRAPGGALAIYLFLAFVSASPILVGAYRLAADLDPAPWADSSHRVAASTGALLLCAFVFVLVTLSRSPRRALLVGAVATSVGGASCWQAMAGDMQSSWNLDDGFAFALLVGLTVLLLGAVWGLVWRSGSVEEQ